MRRLVETITRWIHARPRAAACAALASLAMAAFWPVIGNELVFDDVRQVERARAHLDAHGSWFAIAAEPWWPAPRNDRLWRPLAQVALVAESGLSRALGLGDSTVLLRLVNILLHAAVSIPLFFLARELGLASGAAFIGAALLAIHPLRAEPVHQIVGQAELFAACFMITGGWLYVRARRLGRPWSRIAPVQAAIYALALGSKEHAVLYPLYLGLAELAIRRDRSTVRSEPGEGEIQPQLTGRYPLGFGAVACDAGLAGVLGLYLLGKRAIAGGLVQPAGLTPLFENQMAHMSLAERLPAVCGSFAFAVMKIIAPVRLSPDYSARALPLESGWAWPLAPLGAIAIVGVLLFAFRSVRRGGSGWILIAFLAAAYGLTSNLLIPIGVGVASRLWYWPMTVLGLAMAALWGRLERGEGADPLPSPRKAKTARLIACLIAVLLLAATWSFSPAWRSPREFAERTLERFPSSWRGNFNLARECRLDGDFEQGLARAQVAVVLRPEHAAGWGLVGANAMFVTGRELIAEWALVRAIELDPADALAHLNLARLLASQDRSAEARTQFTEHERLTGTEAVGGSIAR